MGNDKCEYGLGICYLNGFGVTKNRYTAKTYLKKAADKGNEDAAKTIKEFEL